MIYLLALIGLITLAVLLWKGFGPQTRSVSKGSVVGPDDDPEFLWRMGRDSRRSRGSDGNDGVE